MVTFKNITTEITRVVNGEDKQIGYADLAMECLNIIPEGGLTIDLMAKRLRVMEKLKKVELGSSVKLEDADFDELYKACQIRWVMLHKDIVAFDAYLKSLMSKS